MYKSGYLQMKHLDEDVEDTDKSLLLFVVVVVAVVERLEVEDSELFLPMVQTGCSCCTCYGSLAKEDKVQYTC